MDSQQQEPTSVLENFPKEPQSRNRIMYLYFLSFSPTTQAPMQINRSVLCVLEKMGGELVMAAGWGWVHRGWCLLLERQRKNDTDFQELHSFSSRNSIPQQSSAWYRITIHHLRCPSKAVFFLNLFIFSASWRRKALMWKRPG